MRTTSNSKPPPHQNRCDGNGRGDYNLSLYITGTTPASFRAIKNIKAICEELLKGHYKLEVVDVYQRPAIAKEQQVVAAPTLIRRQPLPVRRLIGDMSATNDVLKGLGLESASG